MKTGQQRGKLNEIKVIKPIRKIMWSALCGRDKLDKEIGSQIRSIAHLTKQGKKEKKPNSPNH